MFLLDEFNATGVLRVGPFGLRAAIHRFRRRNKARHRLPIQLEHRAVWISRQPEHELFHCFILGIKAHVRHGGLRQDPDRKATSLSDYIRAPVEQSPSWMTLTAPKI